MRKRIPTLSPSTSPQGTCTIEKKNTAYNDSATASSVVLMDTTLTKHPEWTSPCGDKDILLASGNNALKFQHLCGVFLPKMHSLNRIIRTL